MAELTMLAFDLADKYRNPAVVLADGFVGQMMEPLDLEYSEIAPPEKPWAVKGTPETRANLISSIYLEPDLLEEHQRKLEAKYIRAQQLESRYELYHTEDADVLLIGFGIVSRVLLSAVDALRREGVRAGAFRPITLWPFPAKALARAAQRAQRVLVFELSNGQMIEDVRLSLHDRVPVEFYGRVGGNVPSVQEVRGKIYGLYDGHVGPDALVRAGGLRSPLIAQSATGRTAPAPTYESWKAPGTEQKQVDLFAMVP
jgi:pyruvate/2-oxoacid:ferredoxin oxidoreductase alpha subunit